MTYGEGRALALELLRGDNTAPTITPLLWREAIHAVARHCEPCRLVTTSATGAFREFHPKELDDGSVVRRFVRMAKTYETELDEMDIDEELCTAVVYFLCSFVSNKNKKQFEADATTLALLYRTNHVGCPDAAETTPDTTTPPSTGGSTGGTTGGSTTPPPAPDGGFETDGMIL